VLFLPAQYKTPLIFKEIFAAASAAVSQTPLVPPYCWQLWYCLRQRSWSSALSGITLLRANIFAAALVVSTSQWCLRCLWCPPSGLWHCWFVSFFYILANVKLNSKKIRYDSGIYMKSFYDKRVRKSRAAVLTSILFRKEVVKRALWNKKNTLFWPKI
jgi:hypothetical protein